MSTKVPTIEDVNVDLVNGHVQQLIIVATAKVPRYSNIEVKLNPYYYFVPPANGIYEFDFVANIPDGASLDTNDQVLVTASTIIQRPTANPVKGVKVYGSSNDIIMRLPCEVQEGGAVGNDFQIQSVNARFDKLAVEVRYTGGCAVHDFELQWDGTYLESFPPQVRMKIVHHANGDECEGLKSEVISFDLLDLAPCVIRLSNDYGFNASVSYKLSDLQPSFMSVLGDGGIPIAGGSESEQSSSDAGGGIPILNEKVLKLLFSLIQDKASLDRFLQNPTSVFQDAGITEEESWMFKVDKNSGFTGVLNGFGGVLARLGVRADVLNSIYKI